MNEYVSLASALHIQNICIEILIAWNCVCKYTVRLRFNVLLFIWYDTIRDDTQHNIYYYVLTETERTNLYWRLNWTQPTKLSHIRCIVYYILYTRIYVYQTNRRPMILKYILHFVSVYFSTPASSVECSEENTPQLSKRIQYHIRQYNFS